MAGEVRAYLWRGLRLERSEFFSFVGTRRLDESVLDTIDAVDTTEDVARAMGLDKKQTKRAAQILGHVRGTREQRVRLRCFLRHVQWAQKHEFAFVDLQGVTRTEWEVAQRANPFVLVPHLVELDVPNALSVCADLWLASGRTSRDLRRVGAKAVRYACALITLLRHRDLVSVPVREAAEMATRAGVPWEMDFTEPFDLTFDVLEPLRDEEDMPETDEGTWLRSAPVSEVVEAFRARAERAGHALEYRYWMREERLRLAHQVRAGDDEDSIALAVHVEAREGLPAALRLLLSDRPFEARADAPRVELPRLVLADAEQRADDDEEDEDEFT